MNRIALLFASLALVSCANVNDRPRPTTHVANEGARGTNQGLGYVSRGVRQTTDHVQDVTDDTIDYGGKVGVRQSRRYTDIGIHVTRRADDLALRESKRYTNHVLDTVDKGADYEVRDVNNWSKFGTDATRRAFGSTRKVYQGSVNAYAKSVDRTYWKFWEIFAPEECNPWMVGSKNDCLKCCGPFARVPGGVWTKNVVVAQPEPEVVSEKNPERIMK